MGRCPSCGTEWPDGRQDQLCAHCIIESLPDGTAKLRYERHKEQVKSVKQLLTLLLVVDSDDIDSPAILAEALVAPGWAYIAEDRSLTSPEKRSLITELKACVTTGILATNVAGRTEAATQAESVMKRFIERVPIMYDHKQILEALEELHADLRAEARFRQLRNILKFVAIGAGIAILCYLVFRLVS